LFISAQAKIFSPYKIHIHHPHRPLSRPRLEHGGFDFKILTAFIRLGRARPVRGGVPSIFITIGLVPSILFFLFDFDFIIGFVPSMLVFLDFRIYI
jgi:hypothetical protein